MALTLSSMVALGTVAPDFELDDVVTGRRERLHSLKGGEGTLIMFICQHCPYVQHIKGAIGALARDYHGPRLAVIGISSNDADQYPDDAPEALRLFARQERWNFPFLFDADQDVAKAYAATCTPDFFLYDADLKLVYRGQMDGSRPGNGQPNDAGDLRRALDALLNHGQVPEDQRPSMGCNIKWKKLN